MAQEDNQDLTSGAEALADDFAGSPPDTEDTSNLFPPDDSNQVPEDEQQPGDDQPKDLEDAVKSALDSVSGDDQGQQDQEGEQPGDGDQQPPKDQKTPPGEGAQQDEEDPYAVPEGLKDRQQARFQKLVDLNKEKDGELEQLRENYTGITNAIQSTGAAPEEINALLHYARMIHSDNLQDLQAAYELISKEQSALAQRLGHQTPDYDPLKEYPDLQQKVDNMDIDRESALEIARSRKQQAETNSRTQANRERIVAREEWMAEVEAGRNQLNELSAALEAKDPDFKAKMKIMQPALKGMAKTIHPQLWLNSVADMYRAAGESLAEARPTPKPPGKARQPLGGTSSRGEGAGTPATFESAVMAGLKKVGGSE